MTVRVRFLRPAEVDERERAAWEELTARALEPNPFFEPAFVLPSARWLPSDGVRLMVVEDESGSWRACLPVERVRRWRRVPLPTLASWVHPYCFLGTPLLDGERAEEAARALVSESRGAGAVGLLGLTLMGSGPVLAHLERAAGDLGRAAIRYEETERAALRRSADGDYVTLSRKHEREIARMRRRLGEQLTSELETVQRAGDPRAVEEFLAIEGAGWKGEEGTAFASIEGHADLFREVCAAFAERDRLWLLGLQAGERTVAMKCNLNAGDEVYCFKIAFDEEFARFSPGIQLEVDNVEYFQHTSAYELMDSCAMPQNRMINRLWNGRREIVALAVPAPGALGLLAAPAVRAGRMAARRGGAA